MRQKRFPLPPKTRTHKLWENIGSIAMMISIIVTFAYLCGIDYLKQAPLEQSLYVLSILLTLYLVSAVSLKMSKSLREKRIADAEQAALRPAVPKHYSIGDDGEIIEVAVKDKRKQKGFKR